jgi:hypothetical protein
MRFAKDFNDLYMSGCGVADMAVFNAWMAKDVESSMCDRIGADPDRGEMKIRMNDGKVYLYSQIPRDVLDDLIAGLSTGRNPDGQRFSAGKFYNNEIRGKGYPRKLIAGNLKKASTPDFYAGNEDKRRQHQADRDARREASKASSDQWSSDF